MRCIDKDNDVFYPWVKDENVDGRTFRELLSIYDDNSLLNEIEKQLPLLNILVPDWTWIAEDAFGLQSWDLSVNEVGVSLPMNNGRAPVYRNGVAVFEIKSGEIPTSPVLIIKNNERIVLKPGTKGSDPEYTFRNECYDNRDGDGFTVNTKAYSYTEHNMTVATATNKISYNKVSSVEEQAYSNYLSTGIPQRDYIYYGLTSSSGTGDIRHQYHENLYRFKLKTLNNNYYFDSTGDYSLLVAHPNNNNALSDEDLQSMIWAEGNLEVDFLINLGARAEVAYSRKSFALPIQDAFIVKKVYERVKTGFLGILTERLYYVDRTCFEPKWVEADIDLFNWDVAKYPREYQVSVMEVDDSETLTYSFTYNGTYLTNWTVSSESGNTSKTGSSNGGSSTTQQSVTYTYTRSGTSDLLGDFWVDFDDSIIVGRGAGFALIKQYPTGTVDVLMRAK